MRNAVAEAAARHRAGDRQTAETLYRQALAADAHDADALHGLGCLAHEAGDHALAIGLIGRALSVRPRAGHFHIVLGLALLAEGHHEPARAALALACLREPADWRAHAVHGRILATLGREADALAAFDRALSLAPDSAETQHERASLLLDAGRPRDALGGFEAAHRAAATATTAANLAACLQVLNRPEEALPLVQAALTADPDNPRTLSTSGLALAALGRLDEARDQLSRAHAILPADPAIARNLAYVLYERDDRTGAAALLDARLAADPEDRAARFNRGILHLAEGDYARGWPAWESRHAKAVTLPFRQPDAPPVTLAAEQGLGDTLMFLRYARAASDHAGGAILSLPPELRRAAASLDLPLAEPGRAGVPLGSLPSLLWPRLDRIPPPFVPWHDPQAAAHWRRRLAARYPGALLVGVAWAGSAAYRQDRRRSIPSDLLTPLTALNGVALLSLQRDRSRPAIHDPGAELHDLAETAALIMALDLVVTVDTAIVHLAGGLGKPTWLLDRTGGDWRWLRGRDDSPWYPSVRIHRQHPGEGWEPVITRVAHALRDRLTSGR
jgi:Flp pilus assembly protein TadD